MEAYGGVAIFVAEFVKVMQSLLFIVLLVAIVAFLIFRPSLANRKGKRGEKAAAWYLHRLPSEYRVYSDIMLPTNYGTTQIDHIVISPYGVFVIEVKNMQGIISGHENSESWTQNIYGHRYDMRNPVKQNMAHIIALKSVYKGLLKMPIVSIVAFGHEAKLNVTVDNSAIVHIGQLTQVIRQYGVVYLDREEVSKYCAAIEAANIQDDDVRKAHVGNVRSHVRDRELMIANGRCPQCGGELVQREGKYGRFYGCSNYPHCRFTHTR